MTMNSILTGLQRPFARDVDDRCVRGLRAPLRGLSLLFGLFALGACEAGQPSASDSPVAAANVDSASIQPEESRMWMTVGEHRFAITLADNETARALAALLPLTLDMSEHNGNEKYASLPQRLPTDATRPGTIRNGDLMLFGSDTLVVFYQSFNSSYSYTRLGSVDDPVSLAQALGRRDVRVVFSKD